MLATFGGAGALFASYGFFVRGHNLVWLAGTVLPFATALVYNSARQPEQVLQNAYRYILAKRSASVEMQQHGAAFSEQSVEVQKLASTMRSKNMTLFEVEANLAA